MDARLDLDRLLGLRAGDAHVPRNAGGVVTDDVVRSLCLSQRLLGTEEVMLVHHTDCGFEKVTEEGFAEDVRRDTDLRPPWAVEAFADVDEDVRRSIARVEASAFVPRRGSVRNFVYEVETGRLREVASMPVGTVRPSEDS